jgi:hypothetical protein
MEQETNCQLHVPLNSSHWSPARMVTRQSPYTSSGHRPTCSLTTPPLSSVRSAPQRRKAPFHSSPSSSLVPLLCSTLHYHLSLYSPWPATIELPPSQETQSLHPRVPKTRRRAGAPSVKGVNLTGASCDPPSSFSSLPQWPVGDSLHRPSLGQVDISIGTTSTRSSSPSREPAT